MKTVKTFVVLVFETGRSCNGCIYRFNVGAKTEKEAEELVADWLKKHNLTARTRAPRTYYEMTNGKMQYKQIERVMLNGNPILLDS